MSRRLGTRLASLGALLLSFGAAPDAIRAASSAATGNDTLVVAYPTTPASLDPGVAYDGAGPSVLRGAYEGLVRMRGSSTSAIEGVLATGWSHSNDFTVWTFALRHGVTFHDGTPFNASAVKSAIARTQIRLRLGGPAWGSSPDIPPSTIPPTGSTRSITAATRRETAQRTPGFITTPRWTGCSGRRPSPWMPRRAKAR